MDLPKNDRVGQGKYPVVASTGIAGYHNKYQVDGPGVVIGRSGSIGGGQYIRGKFWPLNTTLWVKNFKGNEPRYCYYLLQSIDFKRFNVGTSVPTLNRNHIHPLPVVKPTLAVQQKVVSLLGGIDDHIQSLIQENNTLESIAQTLFRSWFVNFDPVHAKAAGNAPEAMSAELAELFPSEFEGSELGLIPKGWTASILGSICVNSRTQIQPKNITGVMPYVGLEHIDRKCLSLVSWGHSNSVESGKFKFKKNDILFGKLRPYFHKVAISSMEGVCSTDILVISASTHAWHGFTSMHLFSKSFIEYATQLSDGARMPRTNWADTANYRVVLPPEVLVSQFNSVWSPLLQVMQVNVTVRRALAELRDHLLPRLISGKLSLDEAEKAVEEALAV
jgi:type I restriction enzyme S subunit